MTSTEALVILNMVDHIGPITVRRMMEKFGKVEAILEASISDLRAVEGVGDKSARAIADWRRTSPWEVEL